MTKARAEYIYKLSGIIKNAKFTTTQKGRKKYQLEVSIKHQKNVKIIQAYRDKLENPQIWTTIEQGNYLEKRYIFYCQNYMGQYRLVNWKELNNEN